VGCRVQQLEGERRRVKNEDAARGQGNGRDYASSLQRTEPGVRECSERYDLIHSYFGRGVTL
jgi:hypothetical protein